LGYATCESEPGWGPWPGAPAAGIDRHAATGHWLDPVITLGLWAVREATAQAGFGAGAADPERIGCVFGTSKGGLEAFRFALPVADHTPAHRDHGLELPELWRSVPPTVCCTELTAAYGWQGPALTPVAACATGLVSLIRGAALIRDGACDVVVTGSSDASLQPALLASFRRLGVLAPGTLDPVSACRPCDARRQGFAVGEGAGAIVLERWEHAVARGAPILAEWVDGLQRADPHGLTVLPQDPTALVRLISDLLHRTGLPSNAIDAVSLHGTGTRQNDAYETAALRQVSGSHADQTLGFGIKGGIGHLLGAAGSVESVGTICALLDQVLPQTVNCETPAPDCPLPLTHAGPVRRPLTHVLKLSLGFGGHLAAGLFRRVSQDIPRATRTNSSESV
jgi:3-oxoacyl-[acyl-carrier-protein] synthase II